MTGGIARSDLLLVSTMAIALGYPVAGRAANERVAEYHSYDDLPPPAKSSDIPASQRLELELFVNAMRTGIVASVIRHGDRFQMRMADLRHAGLLIAGDQELVFLDTLEGVQADYDAPRQILHLTVSPEKLPAQRVGGRSGAFEPARYDMGALLNYDVYVTGGAGMPVQASLWHEARAFGMGGMASTTGALRSGTVNGYVRFDSYIRWSDERSMTTVEAGDIITRTLPWVPAVRLGGVQVSRDFSVRPDVITYPLPEFAGTAALPSTVELVVNGRRIAGAQVQPGPFSLDTLPPINGYGQANLIVTDMHGRSVATAMPFYVGSTLLRPRLTDYAVSAGAFRRNYGLRSFDYGAYAASASARHGLTSDITLEMRAEFADDLKVGGAGAVVSIGNLGLTSASYSRSFHRGKSGGQLTVGHEYQTETFSIGVRHVRQDADYVDLGLIDRNDRGWERQTSATAAFSLGQLGTVGLGYFDLERERAQDSRLVNAAWVLPLSGETRLNLSLSHEFEQKSWFGAITLSIPLGGGILSGGAARNQNGRIGLRADYSLPVPVEGGLGWNASAVSEDGDTPSWRAEAIWRTQPVLLRAGAYGRDNAVGWFGATGSLVMMDGGLFVANRVTDAFAVVSTNGQAGIPVRYENQLIGETDSNGQLLIPAASAYYPARYDIDTLALPANVRAPLVSQQVKIAAGSGHVIRFAVQEVVAARGTIRDAAGEPLPAGAIARLNDGLETYVGWDGLIYLENVAPANVLQVTLPEGGSCSASFEVGASDEEIIDLGDLTCR
ncbi:fimbria/pilus outer membrane usher protein [Altererythrobacter xixiisoli]|uniref:Fimbria/pilus outer membrane usher protein n=1 Tax=Croceibacterium xixiisoli TaxID=1476466 RepID=A0A6I4TQA7_9SPHN|nr:fimbria/pilus outer membrane usher protein [Croceibacterium xixiisoli]MXO97519.1 fimbria/pilus outer membrane usher protein [Croceibacterium xixiisoli]